ncbi:hypothetical protein [Herbaspirillum rubrisubalbicans]|uniref:hypothetical protein n=1 Tax=Herbaspirillum rubrisubalbicans TaxID=80842 RepID=UPI0011BED28E|nr:hypothetical protein [Herbaspirillum rubrisubalbicans]
MFYANNTFFPSSSGGTLPNPARATVHSLTGIVARRIVTEPAHEWRSAVSARLNHLIRLDKGWDGYRADPVSFDNANFALRMLEATCPSESPTPQIVPGRNGDLQIEWHTETGDIELHVRGPNDVRAWRYIRGDAEEGVEMDLKIDFTEVTHWLKDLTTGDHVAAEAAAA